MTDSDKIELRDVAKEERIDSHSLARGLGLNYVQKMRTFSQGIVIITIKLQVLYMQITVSNFRNS